MVSDDPTLAREIGRLDGRVAALETRLDRFENGITETLRTIAADVTTIRLATANQDGRHEGRAGIAKFAMWAIPLATGWIVAIWNYIDAHWPR
jgi:hypothetical protein